MFISFSNGLARAFFSSCVLIRKNTSASVSEATYAFICGFTTEAPGLYIDEKSVADDLDAVDDGLTSLWNVQQPLNNASDSISNMYTIILIFTFPILELPVHILQESILICIAFKYYIIIVGIFLFRLGYY